MDLGSDVLWATHPSLRTLSSEEQLHVYQYFQSVERSGGGQVEDFQRVSDERGDTSALLIKFSDPESVGRVCSREHRLAHIFPSNNFVSMEQTLETRAHSTLHSDAAGGSPNDDFIVVSECGDSSPMSSLSGSAASTMKVEVYEFPEDCIPTELTSHFYDNCHATHCFTDDHLATNNDSKTFILEYSVSEAEQILAHPEQFLDDGDDSTRIRVRRYVAPTSRVLVRTEKALNARLIKNSLKKLAAIESCTKLDNDRHFVVTLTSAQDAERLASQQTIALNQSIQVYVELYHGSVGIASGPSPASAFSDRSDSPMGSYSPDVTNVRPSPSTAPATSTTSFPQSVELSSPFRPLTESKVTSVHTHVEIERLSDVNITDMYSLLNLHFFDVLDENYSSTKYEHSYDTSRDLFRFDLKPEDIEKLLGTQQVLIEGEDNSILSIIAFSTGNVVVLKVVKNPGKVGLGKSNLANCFGEKSAFASSLTFLKMERGRAELMMECCSVASLVVSIGEHVLDNKIVLKASFPSTAAESQAAADSSAVESSPKVVLMKTGMSSTVLSKFIKSKMKGIITQQLEDDKYLVEFDSNEAANKVVEQEMLEFMGSKIYVSLYSPVEDVEVEEDNSDLPTHIEVKKHAKTSPDDMHMLIVLHFGEVLGHEVAASINQSYDCCKDLFRFDLSPPDITKLMSSDQYLDESKEKTKLAIDSARTGPTVFIRPAEGSDRELSKTQIKAAFGPKSQFSSKVEVLSYAKDLIELKFDTCSVAALVVSIHKHKLKNGMLVEARFSKDAISSGNDSSTTEEDDVEEHDDLPAEESTSALHKASRQPKASNQPKASRQPKESKAADCLPPKTLLLENLLDVDEQTIYFWIKSLLNVWPLSIQISADGENAIVKVPGICCFGNKRVNEMTRQMEFHLRGEELRVSDVQPATAIQVICSSTQAGATIEEDTLEAYFSNERYTGVKDSSSLQSVKYKTTYNNLPVFVVTYSNSQDVDCVLQRKPHKHGRWRLDVAEFYPLIGVCGQDSLCIYRNFNKQEKVGSQSPRNPVLHINDIDNSLDLDTLQLLMSHRKRTDGGEIASWRSKDGSKPGSTSVQIVYVESDVAERVFAFYKQKGLKINNIELQIELDIPWLTKSHDDHKVRLSGLTNDVDPEKVRFYLSALSDNVVSEIFFNESQTRAVAQFQHAIDYGKILDQAQKTTLKDCPQLRIQQEYKSSDLIATGRLTKDDLELPLENILSSKFGREVEVLAEEFPGTTNMWRIRTEPEALQYILEQKHRLTRCDSISPYSEFLGLHVTSGTQQKTQALSNFVPNPLLLQFLLEQPSGYQRLADHLQSHGIVLTRDGTITACSSSSRKDDRAILKNWRMLKPNLEQFIARTFEIYTTDALTQPIFDKIKHNFPKLVAGQPVVLEINAGGQAYGTGGDKVAIAGEKQLVQRLTASLQQLIKRFELEIQEEKSVTGMTIPNMKNYQIQYLELINFFNDMIRQHKLKAFTGDATNETVSIQGRPTSIDAVQKEMLMLLPKVTQSKFSCIKTPLFLRVFSTPAAQKVLQAELASKQLQAVYLVENKTISVYSDTKATSKATMDCITEVVWEAQYPASHDLDDLEKQLLVSALWRNEKAQLKDVHKPLEIFELGDRPGLSLVGLSQSKNIVMEKIPQFFDINVKRTADFTGIPDRITFLKSFQEGIFKELEQVHNVTIVTAKEDEDIKITGIKDDIADCQRTLQKKHDAICRAIYEVDDRPLVQYVNENREFLETVGLKSRCLVVPHKEDAVLLPVVPPRIQAGNRGSRYSVPLPSGTVCEVSKADITSVNCDAIINAANGDLAHVGGLALAIVNKGGKVIQKECTDYIRKNGQLMEGQVFTSSSGILNCKKIIHAVGPRWRGGFYQEEHTLFSCIDNCFDEAQRYKLKSVAIPPISTGIFGFPLSQAVKAIIDVVKTRETNKAFLPKHVMFVDNKDDSLDMFQSELSRHYKKAQPTSKQTLNASSRKHQSQPVITASTDKLSITGNTICIMKRVNLEIRSGDLSKSEEHTLVNSVGGDLQLTNGKVAQAIAAKAGPQLQAQCNTLAPVAVGDVKETDGFQLTCKKVLHCNCPSYQGAQAVQTLQQIVSKCLTMAASNNHTSIAFPALGTGNLHYPEGEVAKAMIEAVIDYTEKNPNSSLKDVKIVVYHLDKKTQQGFDAELQRLTSTATSTAIASSQPATMPTQKLNLAPKAKQSSGIDELELAESYVHLSMDSDVDKDSVKGCVTVNNTTVRVIEGNIAKHQAEVLVNSTDSFLSNQGQVSKALLAKAGHRVRQETRSLASDPGRGCIKVSGAGDLNASYIFHVDANSCKRSNTAWEALLSNCLERCDEMEARSIAFPALGTGVLSIPTKEMAKIMLQATIRYLNDNPRSTLRNIDVVIFLPEMVDDFVHSMQQSIEKREGWWTRVAVKVSGWITGAFSADAGRKATRHSSLGASRASPSARESNRSGAEDGRLKLDIYGATDANIQACKSDIQAKLGKVIETVMWKDKPTYLEDREFISKLSGSQERKLQDEANRLRVKLNIDKRLCDIRIAGLSKETYAMADIVARELKALEKQAHEKKEEGWIALAIQWMYEEGSGGWAKFDVTTNKALEDTYKKNPNALYRYDTDDGEVKLDLSKMEGRDASYATFKIQRNDLSKRSELAMPSNWSSPLDVYQEITLVPATPEYKKVEDDFLSTVGARGNAVLEVRRIQNPTLYQHYIILRKDVAKRLGKKEDQVEKTPLWHGTDEDTVSKITGGKFDRGLSGKNATALGCGSYFAKKSSYSAQNTYSKPNSQGQKYIIQTRVITGDWCQGTQQLRAAPYKNQAQTEQYDSVVDNPNDPSIFVVFNDASAYPEYIIKFQ